MNPARAARVLLGEARGRGYAHRLREQSDLPGFDTERLLTTEILLGGTAYFDKTPDDMNLVTPQTEVFFDAVLERVRALPGVTRAGIVSRVLAQTTAEPVALAAIAAVMTGAALLAAWVPVHRVTRVDPQRALRYE